MQGELHDLLLHGDGVVSDEGNERRTALYLFLLVEQPSFDDGSFFVQCGFDLALGAFDERCLCGVVANPADRHDKQHHDCPRQEKFLLDAQCARFLSIKPINV